MSKKTKNIIICISGRGSNMAAIVKESQSGILKNFAKVQLVYSNNSEAAGLKFAKDQGLQTKCISSKGKKRAEYNQLMLDFFLKQEFDCIVLAGYMRILSNDFVKAFSGKIINIHPADTNEHKGLDAYNWAFENGLKETKITVHHVDEGVDTGTIIEQKKIDISSAKTLEEVEQIGLKVEHQFYSEVLLKLFNSNT